MLSPAHLDNYPLQDNSCSILLLFIQYTYFIDSPEIIVGHWCGGRSLENEREPIPLLCNRGPLLRNRGGPCCRSHWRNAWAGPSAKNKTGSDEHQQGQNQRSYQGEEIDLALPGPRKIIV